MSKFYGAIGYSVTEEIRPGVWGEKITVRDYYGDVIRNTRQYQSSGRICSCGCFQDCRPDSEVW